MNTRIATLLLLTLTFAAGGGNCGTGDACTQIAVPSVVLRVANPLGIVPVASAVATWRINGGRGGIAECRNDCDDLVLAFELVGRFDIQVEAPGYKTASLSVTVERDSSGCHPVTQYAIVAMEPDPTVGALDGAWRGISIFGRVELRFDDGGKAVGAILYGQRATGDRNYYVQFNGRTIRGVPNQTIFSEPATEPTRINNEFNFFATPQGVPVGFQNAGMSAGFTSLAGTLSAQPITYERLEDIPEPLRDR